jgi:hypothetical protein
VPSGDGNFPAYLGGGTLFTGDQTGIVKPWPKPGVA